MKKIELTRGLWALVDDEDYDDLNQYYWYADKKGFAVRNVPEADTKSGYTTEAMHRYIMKAQPWESIIQKDGDRLNNQKYNLVRGPKAGHRHRFLPGAIPTRYRGVSRQQSYDKYRATICLEGKMYHLGWYDTMEEAALAYNEEAQRVWGSRAYLNEVVGKAA